MSESEFEWQYKAERFQFAKDSQTIKNSATYKELGLITAYLIKTGIEREYYSQSKKL